mmetsp:Transcript_13495/g.20282  ORF Transcript_13495/g.20282 Transcript_13495/m.20282 type:complete len:246 (+) Transcript_13495:122-859(+)|eukprot:CAMPEP_0185028296 /NCGR_PEP_ID=MMETSP1103-20130426/13946_1 /TAXON_ID=36769 /ORGANISM="Paraphysomonas bandaiensis, Strain Caron Lab Isolate" /LENGTH=245 /DNA_ID=CAMNT_0027562671 /DNA_START=69 /DNA_END=806 /DNA_ORIENTATION=+
MVNIKEQLTQAFGEFKSLYEILGISKTASCEQIKKSYKKLALKHHPDKGGDPEKFKALSMVHSILSDESRRRSYDTSGDIDGEEMCSDLGFWYHYFRDRFPQFSTADIDSFGAKYKGSEEEKQDILKAYTKYSGNFEHIMECVMLAEEVDRSRIAAIIDQAIDDGYIERLDTYDYHLDNSKKKRKVSSISCEDDDSLRDMINMNRSNRLHVLEDICSKYSNKDAVSKKMSKPRSNKKRGNTPKGK